jgi:regulator of RNase E activity RraA
VQPGDILHGDRHGLLNVPHQIAAQIPAVATKLQQGEQRVIDFCRSEEFAVDQLGQIMKDLSW